MEGPQFLIDVLRDAVGRLDEIACGYALAGGLAYSAWVEPRATVDIDFVIILPPGGWQEICQGLAPIFQQMVPHKRPLRLPRVTIWRTVGFRQGREVILDFMECLPAFQESIVKRRISLRVWGIDLPVITPEDLFLLKAMSARLQDQSDMEMLRLTWSGRLDEPYIRRWASALGLDLTALEI